MSNKTVFTIFLMITAGFGLFSCSKDVQSNSTFIHKPAPDKTTAAKMGTIKITNDELVKGIEMDIFEAEMKVYELKMNKLKALVLEKVMEADPKKKGLTNDQYLEKYITKDVAASKKDIEAFIVERKIPKEQINDHMRKRIKDFLEIELKKKAIDKWLAGRTAKSPVEVYVHKPKRPVFNVAVGDAPTLGGANAKVTIVEFSDFQCPFCAKGAKVLTELKKKYGNKIKVAFKNFPLPFHNHAELAAQAGLCVKEQSVSLFWKMHDTMFENQTKLDNKGLEELAKKVGANVTKFKSCVSSGKYAAKVKKDMGEGKDVGVKSTPTFFVNGQMINGAHPIEVFSEIIDSELKK